MPSSSTADQYGPFTLKIRTSTAKHLPHALRVLRCAGDHLVGWRNASLRAMHEQPGWDVAGTRGTGVVREDPPEAGMWPPGER